MIQRINWASRNPAAEWLAWMDLCCMIPDLLGEP